MGYIRHHAIVVTATYGVDGLDSEHWIDKAHRAAQNIIGEAAPITEPTATAVNGTRSFLIAPDGSKEGWDESEKGDAVRDRYIDWLRQQEYEDHSSPLAWVLVQYGDDERETVVVADSDEAWRVAYP